MRIFRLFIVIFFISFFCIQCVTGPARSRVKVYNNKNEVIIATFKLIDVGEYEINYNIMPNMSQPLDNKIGLHKPASKVYEYVIIKDENDNELMNLRGETLNNTVTIETDDEDHVIYRLDVN